MNETWYLLDNNALLTLTRAERSGRFVRERCRIPTEVLYEAQGYPDIAALRRLEFEMNPDILERVRRVMASVSPKDAALVDLYANKGNADPILIATAMYARELSETTLLPDEWVVVTNDRAVQRTAAQFGVPTLRSNEFRGLVRAS
ncbi:MAG TPA: hypothetical protein VGE43_11585 [Acidimicrobiales bacterium]